jgi:hypothetical protein
MSNMSKQVQVQRVVIATAAGTTTITSDAVDMAGFESAMFVFSIGTITSGAALSWKVQQSSDDAATDAYSDLVGTNQAIADTASTKVSIVEIYKPEKRYLKVVITRATQNVVIDGVNVHKGQPKLANVVNGSTVVGSETHLSPEEGTA